MNDQAQSALAACQDYVHWKAVIKKLSSDIGAHLHLCQTNEAKEWGPVNETHLSKAYRPEHINDETIYMAPDEIIEFLREACPHCLAAHKAIQERKAAKQKLGAAKRWISRVGKVTP